MAKPRRRGSTSDRASIAVLIALAIGLILGQRRARSGAGNQLASRSSQRPRGAPSVRSARATQPTRVRPARRRHITDRVAAWAAVPVVGIGFVLALVLWFEVAGDAATPSAARASDQGAERQDGEARTRALQSTPGLDPRTTALRILPGEGPERQESTPLRSAVLAEELAPWPPAYDPPMMAVPAVQPVDRLSLRIPKLAVDAPIVALGLTEAGDLDVPQDGASVGWYTISSRPGELGNALLGGHFDWEGSLAVFHRLSELRPGDRIDLVDENGAPLVYSVQSVTQVEGDRPLAEFMEFGDRSQLTLVTCGGAFDLTGSEYELRVVVSAALRSPSPLAAHP